MRAGKRFVVVGGPSQTTYWLDGDTIHSELWDAGSVVGEEVVSEAKLQSIINAFGDQFVRGLKK